jgi:MFS family permease
VMTTSVSALLLAAAIGLIAISPPISVVIGAVAVTGLLNGVVVPATASMIGLECPSTVQSTVFGFNSSAVAFGFFAGPLIAGGVAAGASVSVGLAVSAILAVVLGILLAVGAREPVR